MRGERGLAPRRDPVTYRPIMTFLQLVAGLARPVDVGTVVDVHDDVTLFFVDADQNAIVTAPGAAVALECPTSHLVKRSQFTLCGARSPMWDI